MSNAMSSWLPGIVTKATLRKPSGMESNPVMGASVDELNNHIDEFKKISAGFGISPVVEDFAARVSWFAQIPGFDPGHGR